MRHVGIVELGEAEGRLAQFAVLLVRVREPFHETFLVDELDAAAAFARMEERFVGGAVGSTDATGGRLVGRGGVSAGGQGKGGIVHKVGWM